MDTNTGSSTDGAAAERQVHRRRASPLEETDELDCAASGATASWPAGVWGYVAGYPRLTSILRRGMSGTCSMSRSIQPQYL
jgi:hypothetical protein